MKSTVEAARDHGDPGRGRDFAALRRELEQGLTVTGSGPSAFAARTREGSRVLVERVEGSAIGWFVVCAPICPQTEMDLARALERNGNLGITTLMLRQGVYWLRLAVPLDSVELDDPLGLVSMCVAAARSLSPSRLPAVAGASEFFSHYTE